MKNDETVFTLATDTATSTRAGQIKTLASKYVSQWNTIRKHVQKCGTIAP
ncbi:hypothetical protein GCM10025864_28690 [Luteimicrobium album]|uniref:Transposase n=1 Tax=Luteimicrobium album TaxID=1054550 RepID=A0ABQ6I5R0_9MICO|nr:hypothetical protein [Luteimicrobium album]GMA25110.1 hypothetical protein GCM10025864_28690 [Luteimicrobium album]